MTQAPNNQPPELSARRIARGRMRPFSELQVAEIRRHLEGTGSPRDRAIFETWFVGQQRVSDFRQLTVADVRAADGSIRSRLVTAQRKVSTATRCKPVEVVISPRAQIALAELIAAEAKQDGDYLFTRPGCPHGEPLCRKQLARLVKGWASVIGLDTHRIAAHTMRRTRAAIAYRKGTAKLTDIQHWLGHKDYGTTVAYVGVEAEDALRVSEQNCF